MSVKIQTCNMHTLWSGNMGKIASLGNRTVGLPKYTYILGYFYDDHKNEFLYFNVWKYIGRGQISMTIFI